MPAPSVIPAPWPPVYRDVFARRLDTLVVIQHDNVAIAALRRYYKLDPVAFINDWGVTIDPRNAPGKLPTLLPFVLFPRQRDFVEWLAEHISEQRDGLCEKTRDMGATWLCVAVSVWLWLFYAESAVGWGSMGKDDVDKIGDPSSIFEKIRIYINYLPAFLRPEGLKGDVHLTSMRCINPANGSTITGDVGKNIGRGGRTTVYFKDESSHYEGAEKIEASLGDNTNVQIDISSVNGEGNVFHRRRMSLPEDDVFIMDWRHHPHKTQAWHDDRQARAVAMGLEHVFAQEVDRDYAAAIQGVCIPSLWVKASVGLVLDDEDGVIAAGLDVATEDGADSNALVVRRGSTLLRIPGGSTWQGLDGSATAHRADEIVIGLGGVAGETIVQYDAIGVGAAIAAPAKHTECIFTPVWIGSTKLPGFYDPVLPLDAPTDDDDYTREVRRTRNATMFRNKKARRWWLARERFRRTWQHVTGQAEYHHDDLVSLPAGSDKLQMQLSQPRMFKNDAGKRILESKEQLQRRGIPSPDEAEAFILSYDDMPALAAPSLRII